MDLASHQRILLGLVRASYSVTDDDDAYFHKVARSRDLEEARGNIFLWRVYVLERTCVLTVSLLRQRRRLGRAVSAFTRRENISPFREFQPLAFLASLANDPDHLVASVSQFELALMKVRAGDAGAYVVAWHTEPQRVLKRLAEDALVQDEACTGAFVTRVSGKLPYLFEIEASDASAG